MTISERCIPRKTRNHAEKITDVGPFRGPIVLELPYRISWEQRSELCIPVERAQAIRERGDVASVGKVIYEDSNSTRKECLRT